MALFLPAFGDEMNQTRRMLKLLAESFAAVSIESCVFDLYGTGDSSADFKDATVERWMADCRLAAGRLRADRDVPLMLFGCRLGAALAVQLSHELTHAPVGLIGWAPLFQGRMQLSGMLRLEHMRRMQRDAASNQTGAPILAPKNLWERRETAIVGGYPISAALAEQLEAFDVISTPRAEKAALFELRLPGPDASVSPSEALRKRAAAWTEQGVQTVARAVAGPAFWNVADLVDVPELVHATVGEADRLLEGVGI
jgi:exosortase A-associated hydrolase 2